MADSRGRKPISPPISSEHSKARGQRGIWGRRKGPALSARQDELLATLLPKLELKLEPSRDPRAYFDAPVRDVWLEIGFGAGEHLLWQAERNPDTGLIGAEPYISGMAKLLSKIAAPSGSPVSRPGEPPPPLAGEESNAAFSSPVHGGGAREAGGGGVFGNIRLYSASAHDIVAALPDASISRVFILFPDPWPKKRHHKRRFIQMESLGALARVMKAGAELRFATDDAGYMEWALERLMAHEKFEWLAQCAADWRARSADWPQTRYEAKAIRAGRPCTYLRFARKA
jgi:tRNA (guanine-N7-)-methyltransferase